MYISDVMQAMHTVTQEEVRLSKRHPVKVAGISGIRHDVAPHDHEFYEVVLIRSGRATHMTSDGERPLGRGDLLVVSPGQVHAISSPRNLSLFNVYYLSEWLLQDFLLRDVAPQLSLLFLGQHLFPDRSYALPIHVNLPSDCCQQVTGELQLLARLSGLESPNALLMKASLIKAFAWIVDSLPEGIQVDHEFIQHALVQHLISCVDRALDDGAPGNVANWAERVNYSADHFCRRIRALTGESPNAFYQRRRLQRAVAALVHGQESVSEIAHRLGFTDSAHFCRVFKASYQLSPSAYRDRFPG
ncbi:AraC family transcriptional regulator [Cerasicoccus fimbriatus]|uniref:AraC family transcriptional regulator n=1 Tax=Cerasicoccus fimbriatus TaxID=3014554 RepID=UPI0022B50F86|nr:AraC family transcriptional regulator [Cerasicoccus sp. TK19100]